MTSWCIVLLKDVNVTIDAIRWPTVTASAELSLGVAVPSVPPER